MTDYAVFEEIKASPEEVLSCSFSTWYPFFKDNAIEAVNFKPLPKEFLDYLASDSIRLPANDKDPGIEVNSDNDYSDWESDDNEESNHNEKKETDAHPERAFQNLHDGITREIERLGGAVIPKLNWSAPKDARWVLINNILKCTNASDVYLLLNASDHIVHDLDHPFDDIEQELPELEYELVLKKWLDINPALEFRVFVKDRKIVGVSQRDLNYYQYLTNLKPQIRKAIEKFWDKVVEPSNYKLKNFIIDIYIPRPFSKVFIVDINPFSRKYDPLLFTWNEIISARLSETDFEIRLLSEPNVNRFARKEYTESQVPLDVVEAAADPESMADLARTWVNAQKED